MLKLVLYAIARKKAQASAINFHLCCTEELLYELTYACGQGASNATNSAKAVIKVRGKPDSIQLSVRESTRLPCCEYNMSSRICCWV